MKKILLIFIVILLFNGCNSNSNQINTKDQNVKNSETAESLKLGYCLTMKSDAQNLQKQNENIEPVPFGSAGEVLANLKAEKIDWALIGRRAEKIEVNENILEKKLFETGFTLIAPQKSFIAENKLANLEVKTCLEKDFIKAEFGELENITFIESSNCVPDNQKTWLIDWTDWTDSMNLLIPIDQNGNKVKKYRSSFLYGENFNDFNF